MNGECARHLSDFTATISRPKYSSRFTDEVREVESWPNVLPSLPFPFYFLKHFSKLINFIFWSRVRFATRLNGKYRDFLCTLCPYSRAASPTSNTHPPHRVVHSLQLMNLEVTFYLFRLWATSLSSFLLGDLGQDYSVPSPL